MEDAVSHSSLDSDEYVMVNGEPKLKVSGNGNVDDLERRMQEAILSSNVSCPLGSSDANTGHKAEEEAVMRADEKADMPENANKDAEEKLRLINDPLGVSRSANKPSVEASEQPPVAGTMGDETKSSSHAGRPRPLLLETSSTESQSGPTTVENVSVTPPPSQPIAYTVFSRVTYLGCASVNAPRSDAEVMRNMHILNEKATMSIDVTLLIPDTSEGSVRISEPGCDVDMASYRIHRILFCARGHMNSSEARCFAFTCSHGDSIDTTIFQCHVFRCEIPEAVGKVLMSFANAFRRVPRLPSSGPTYSPGDPLFKFEVSLEVKEEDGKGSYAVCPKDKSCFKLRRNLEKKLVLSVQQTAGFRELVIERCFGLLISPGRNVKNSDMHLLDMVAMGTAAEGKQYVISGVWNPADHAFDVLNTETSKDTRVFMTVAVDLVIVGIQEPVRFIVETKAKIFPQNERFWYYAKRSLTEQFFLKLKEDENSGGSGEQHTYLVVSIESATDIERRKSMLPLSTPHPPATSASTGSMSTLGDNDDDSDADEPLMSGSGDVSKDCTEGELEDWAEVLSRWHQNLKQRPSKLTALVRRGIPEALRGEVWQLLAGCTHDEEQEMFESYRILITNDSPCEQVIARDIHRTFPAHDFFKEAGGLGQDSLFKLSKAYSVYDEEIGYCQGQSFLAAALLLHIPEEQAFCILVKIMFEYGHRNIFRQNFEELHLKFYQLERLIEDHVPELFNHFMETGVETHMFASQWFLTLFTAKFPLFMVFRILDIYLSEGEDTVFLVAIALLKTSRKDLLALDFEGILKYFRVSLPKKYRTEEHARELLQVAMGLKKSNKKLKKYEKEYITMKEQELQQEDPVTRLERENKRLQEANMRLEQENDDLAHELVTSKIALRNELDMVEDKAETLQKELMVTHQMLTDVEEDKARHELESVQLKEMCRRELQRSEGENSRNTAIIVDYKQICTQLSERLEKQQTASRTEMARIKSQIQSCERCSRLLSPDGNAARPFVAPPAEGAADPRLRRAEDAERALELELAQTKLALVEAECRTQELTHRLGAAHGDLAAAKNTWFQKTLNSIKDAAATTATARGGGGGGSGGGGVAAYLRKDSTS